MSGKRKFSETSFTDWLHHHQNQDHIERYELSGLLVSDPSNACARGWITRVARLDDRIHVRGKVWKRMRNVRQSFIGIVLDKEALSAGGYTFDDREYVQHYNSTSFALLSLQS
jgi:hypothetical protein